ncbi:hypothetical protein [Aestuariivirga sp.]|uniref:hypothetical protein n=1 Tax=Aestuariivirga sp. TaxID=2650926 RepID=UPI0039E68D7A
MGKPVEEVSPARLFTLNTPARRGEKRQPMARKRRHSRGLCRSATLLPERIERVGEWAFQGETVRIRIGLSAVLLACAPALADQTQPGDEAATLVRQFHAIQISCGGMAAVDYAPAHEPAILHLGQPSLRAVDEEACEKTLKPSSADVPLAPVLNLIGSSQSMADVTASNAIDSVQGNLKSAFEACETVPSSPASGMFRVCFFGGPAGQSSVAFRAVFDAMVNNTIPEGEALCAKFPFQQGMKTEPEFTRLAQAEPATWLELQHDLQRDGFDCDAKGCSKLLLSLVIAPHTVNREGEWPQRGVIPRLLSVYQGKWFRTGPPSFHCRVPLGDTSKKCDDHPARGASEGLCMVGEDEHVWAPAMCMFNHCQ